MTVIVAEATPPRGAVGGTVSERPVGYAHEGKRPSELWLWSEPDAVRAARGPVMASWADGLGRLGLIALGGGVGSVGRYLTAGLAYRVLGAGFPFGTLAVNAIGCFVIGWLNVRLLESGQVSPEIRSAITIGVLGGFTTFSTFGWETLEMMNDRQFGRAALNVGVNVICSLIAVWLGYRLAMREVGVA